MLVKSLNVTEICLGSCILAVSQSWTF